MTGVTLPVGPAVDATPAQLPDALTLCGRFGSVAKVNAARDAAALWQSLRGYDEVWTYISSAGPFADEAAFSQWLAGCEASKDPYFCSILDTGGRAVGLLALMAIRPQMRVIEVGNIVYSRALQRTPLGTEAQYLLARLVFETLGYRRYEWKCNSLNGPSRRAALRYGFVFEGILRQHMIVKGHSRDTAYFSMLESEWPARKRNFERWLSADNFDADGRQKVSLAVLNGQKVCSP
jgi:RimJ/RimL family protein N-acetyltransferase